jgi:predicted nucleic acid-binding protein
MSGVDFFDSNVLIYLFDQNEARRRGVAEGLVRQALATDSAVISHQVVQETLHVVPARFSRHSPLPKRSGRSQLSLRRCGE